MYQRITFCILLVVGLSVAQTINLHGKVSNTAGKPIAKAIVTLANQGLKDTTGADGAYIISNATPVRTPIALIPKTRDIVLNNGVLEFSLPEPLPVKIEIYSIEGKLLKREALLNVSSGFYRYDINKNYRTKLLVVRASIGPDEYTFRYIPSLGSYSINQTAANSTAVSGMLAKITAVNDTIIVTADNYKTTKMAVASYDQQLDITLDTAGNNKDFHYRGNPPGPSAGCGKDLGSWKTGTYSITSSGLSRRYIIDIPANYNKNNPYRLIFAPHCMCGSMWSVESEKFYRLKHIADSTKNYCIFVAPSVYNGGKYDKNNWGCPVWDQKEKDHAFFDDMLKLFKGELCIDTTRVFCAGFSFGSMFTNSLAQNHQKVLRAVACYATANYNIYVPKNTGEPIAWMGTVGLADGTCPPSAGRACRDTVVKYNGCTKPGTVPEATKGSKKHVVYDYQGCPEYPVKWCTFDGDHQWAPVDGTSSGWDPVKTWVPYETWKFFMQF